MLQLDRAGSGAIARTYGVEGNIGNRAPAGADREGFFTVEGSTLRRYLYAPSTAPAVLLYEVNADTFQLRWDSDPGVGYQLESSGDLEEWVSAGDAVLGTGAIIIRDVALGEPVRYFRIRAQP